MIKLHIGFNREQNTPILLSKKPTKEVHLTSIKQKLDVIKKCFSLTNRQLSVSKVQLNYKYV